MPSIRDDLNMLRAHMKNIMETPVKLGYGPAGPVGPTGPIGPPGPRTIATFNFGEPDKEGNHKQIHITDMDSFFLELRDFTTNGNQNFYLNKKDALALVKRLNEVFALDLLADL